jgi:hypothetical protein
VESAAHKLVSQVNQASAKSDELQESFDRVLKGVVAYEA